jgi:hypothetical protein
MEIGEFDLECLIELVPAGHDHQDVHIAIGVRRSELAFLPHWGSSVSPIGRRWPKRAW